MGEASTRVFMAKRSRVPDALLKFVTKALHEVNRGQPLFPSGLVESHDTSAVLFLLGEHPRKRHSCEPCIILSKRSMSVRQPGDLCFPGGRISLPLDLYGARILSMLPFTPLARWVHRTHWKFCRRREIKNLALLLAAGLRESFEEMRLNPLKARFLGPMPSQNLAMFSRVLYPMVVWIRQKHFLPNWEVERIIAIPLSSLLDPGNYACCRMFFETDHRTPNNSGSEDFPCFRHPEEREEVLWGVTYRIVTHFLEMVFKFKAPEMTSLPVIHRTLGGKYFYGSVRASR
jgi:8-oxo-dGTP pyrophosphatase MutT (NUDIX family)